MRTVYIVLGGMGLFAQKEHVSRRYLEGGTDYDPTYEERCAHRFLVALPPL